MSHFNAHAGAEPDIVPVTEYDASKEVPGGRLRASSVGSIDKIHDATRVDVHTGLCELSRGDTADVQTTALSESWSSATCRCSPLLVRVYVLRF